MYRVLIWEDIYEKIMKREIPCQLQCRKQISFHNKKVELLLKIIKNISKGKCI